MTRSLLRAVALASALLLSSSVTAQSTSSPSTSTPPTTTNGAKAITTLGCYSHSDPLTSQGDYTFQTPGYCQGICVALNMPVMAITGGSTCYCGTEFPALDSEVDISSCNTPCNGYNLLNCGGIGFWQVYLTGLTGDVETAPNSTTSTNPTSTSGSGSGASQSTAARPTETIMVTQSASASPDKNKPSGGGSKVGIAVGVVVGVIAIASIIGGVLLYIRGRRNRDIEEEHRRNMAVNSFVGSQKSDKSSNDQRLDPSIYSHRRESIGSIADERDFSRRILQVRNPDRESKQSALATMA